MKTLKTLKRELLADTKTRSAYDDQANEFALARELIAARTRARLSQREVARRMGTTQSVVARLESGRRTPSMRTIQRFAQAVGGHLVVKIARGTTPAHAQ
jgi:ribosome-binding protein aMBF1 (putative translation factor)